MGRLVNAFEQFFDASGSPLIQGKLYFFESGSSTAAKDTYSDPDESKPNSNPVLLGGDGRAPNVFGNGSYRVVLTDSDDVQILARDPVGGETGTTFGADWNSQSVYGLTDVVRDDNKYWESLSSENVGNKPSTDDGSNWIRTIVSIDEVTEIITDISSLFVSNVEELELSEIPAGATVSTKGFSAAGDGGSALYLISPPQAVDGRADHLIANENAAILQGRENGINALQFGAYGDGSTDDKTLIDILNIAGQTVNLGGKSHRYIGDFSVVADFTNGIIIADNGAFDYTDDRINYQKIITVGASGTFSELNSALQYAGSLTFGAKGSLVISVLSEAVQYTGITGTEYTFKQPEKVSLVGQARVGAVPTLSELSPTRATGIATIRGRYNSIVEVRKPSGGSASTGLFLPAGLALIKDICFENFDSRYTCFIGNFTGSFTGIFGVAGSATVDSCSFVGGTWGLQGVDSAILLKNDNLMAYQDTIDGNQAGGGLRMQGPASFVHNGEVGASYSTRIYEIGSGATAAQVGVQIQDGTARLGSASLDIEGCRTPLLANRGGTLNATSVRITKGEYAAYARDGGSHLNIGGAQIIDCNTAGANVGEQVVDGRPNTIRALIAAGAGSTVITDQADVSGSEAHIGYYASEGGFLTGTTNNVDDCKFFGGVDAARTGAVVANGGKMFLRLILTNPRASSVDFVRARRGGSVEHDNSSGVSFDPAVTAAPSVIYV